MKMKFHTRREFIKTTALAAASVSFTGALARTRAPPGRTGKSDSPSPVWAV